MNEMIFGLWAVIIAVVLLAIIVGWLVMPLYVIQACRRYREEYLSD
jgi:hypothetical protein